MKIADYGRCTVDEGLRSLGVVVEHSADLAAGNDYAAVEQSSGCDFAAPLKAGDEAEDLRLCTI